MGLRPPRPNGHFEFLINYKFNSELQGYYERNRHRFPNNYPASRQYLFELGMKKARETEGAAQRALANRREFLDPKRKSVSVILNEDLINSLKSLSEYLPGTVDMASAASVALKIGYDVDAGT